MEKVIPLVKLIKSDFFLSIITFAEYSASFPFSNSWKIRVASKICMPFIRFSRK